MMAHKHNHVALGGTFDLLHKGHESVLQKAFTISKLVTIGITTDKFCSQSGKALCENQTLRHQKLLSFLKSKNWIKRTKIIWLRDIYGNTLNDKSVEAVVVSHETRKGANQVNTERLKRKLKKLTIITVPQVLAYDKKPISSGRIRTGEINTNGQSYESLLLKIAGKRFNPMIRQRLKIPFGPETTDSQLKNIKPPVITIGDITTAKFTALKISPKLAVVDFFVNRKRIYQNLQQLGITSPNPDYLVKNTPGQVSKDLITTINKSYRNLQNQVILVDGEEDLAFIPALLLAPITSFVFYGQPHKGLIKVEVTPSAKAKLCTLLNLAK